MTRGVEDWVLEILEESLGGYENARYQQIYTFYEESVRMSIVQQPTADFLIQSTINGANPKNYQKWQLTEFTQWPNHLPKVAPG